MPKQKVTARQLETLEKTLEKLKTEMCQYHSRLRFCYSCPFGSDCSIQKMLDDLYYYRCT